MAVEILILSGVRQGERLVLDGREFRAGSDPACEVCFDAARDCAVQGRSVQFRLQEDGWRVRCSGGGVFVNQQPIAGWTRVRSGDVVRMSEAGPDFSFGIVAGEAGRLHSPDASPTRSPVGEPTADTRQGDDTPVVSALSRGTVRLSSALGRETVRFRPNEDRGGTPVVRPSVGRQWALWAGGGLAIGILALVMVRSVFFSPPPPSIPAIPGSTPTAPSRSAPPPEKPPETVVPPPETAAPPVDIAAQLKDAVFLIQVEKSGSLWPFATCVAIADDTLLTSAREAAQLAKWQAEDGFKIWVTRPADGFKEEVQDFRINGVYASLAEKPNDWIFFDLGLLVVRGKLPKVAPLASPEELAALEAGIPVACFGFAHEGEKVTRFDKFEPRLTQGKVFLVTVSQELPDRPRLLHVKAENVKAEIPKNAYGSPIVNGEGRLIGIYGEVAAPPTGEPAPSDSLELKKTHYVTVVNLEMLNLWLRDPSDKMWLPAVAPRTPEPTQDKP